MLMSIIIPLLLNSSIIKSHCSLEKEKPHPFLLKYQVQEVKVQDTKPESSLHQFFHK